MHYGATVTSGVLTQGMCTVMTQSCELRTVRTEKQRIVNRAVECSQKGHTNTDVAGATIILPSIAPWQTRGVHKACAPNTYCVRTAFLLSGTCVLDIHLSRVV